MNRLLSFFLAAVMLTWIASTVSAGDLPFTDVPSAAWYCDEVEAAYDAGIMKGKTETTFDPTANMTRAEFVTVLSRLSGEDCGGFGALLDFTDTKTDAWYSDAVAWGASNGLVKGLPENKFAPSAPVTRQEMAVFIDRLMSYMDLTLEDSPKVDSFKDADSVARFAEASVELMRKSGIITGDSDGCFNPTNNASRAEIATVVTRLLPVVNGDSSDGDSGEAVIDRENFDEQKAFLFSDENWSGLPYRIYLPEDYTDRNEYPLVIFVGAIAPGTDNISHLNHVNAMFSYATSPAFDSIVVVPQCPVSWNEAMANRLMEVAEHVNSQYSTDSERQYLIGGDVGTWPLWKMINLYPDKFSAVLFLSGPTLLMYDVGYDPTEINPEMLDMGIHLVYSIDDIEQFNMPGAIYAQFVRDSLVNEGATNISITTVTGYAGDVYNRFVCEADTALLDWLYTQRRETN